MLQQQRRSKSLIIANNISILWENSVIFLPGVDKRMSLVNRKWFSLGDLIMDPHCDGERWITKYQQDCTDFCLRIKICFLENSVTSDSGKQSWCRSWGKCLVSVDVPDSTTTQLTLLLWLLKKMMSSLRRRIFSQMSTSSPGHHQVR